MLLLILCLLAYQSHADPYPTGGKRCNYTSDCGDGTITGGICDWKRINGTEEMVCICNAQYGNVDCSYHRKDKALAGGLQIGLSFAGIFGVGNFILGNTAHAVGQLVMGLINIVGVVLILCVMCCGAFGGKGGIIGGASLSGFIGCLICATITSGWAWNLADGIKMLIGILPDANGYDLA